MVRHPPVSPFLLRPVAPSPLVPKEQKNDDEKKDYCNKQSFETKRKTKVWSVTVQSFQWDYDTKYVYPVYLYIYIYKYLRDM